ncbi:aminotransferase class V-fold PLP-dependent enzyme [Saccharibacter sp. 17.LH.SD]|uniref:cysteine desulfurase family protein n=1 Tax=Saccharibacter sp. 17.LH.SD TaxID=2689393 RepID=UPI00136E695E|nr:cysteine desulfurase family protein [Saccharibacter sp. 17.LH.SD]MXV43620.1 aminotransferase class V-fold PLP-dependent enzyme [Saccharibacter sp. 17.LH.SD]
MIYLDYLATTPCDPVVVETMLPWFAQDFGNAGSLHAAGRKAQAAVEEARQSVASLLGVHEREIIFTSGATEANNMAIKGAARFLRQHGDSRRRVITVATEHKCVLEAVKDLEGEGFEPVILPVEGDGRLSPFVLAEALRDPPLLVSIMAANNETGVLHDMPSLAPLVKEAGSLLHVDMAQVAGKIPFDLSLVDLASLSSHKIYGPKGVGALYVRHRPRVRLQPLFSGGGQERGLRSGTLPVPLIVGFGYAAQLAHMKQSEESSRLSLLRDQLVQKLCDGYPECVVNGGAAPRLPGVVNLRLPKGFIARDVMAALPDIACSTGSACTAASGVPSYVLESMGLSEAEAQRSLRLSVGRFTSGNDIDDAVMQFRAVLDGQAT